MNSGNNATTDHSGKERRAADISIFLSVRSSRIRPSGGAGHYLKYVWFNDISISTASGVLYIFGICGIKQVRGRDKEEEILG